MRSYKTVPFLEHDKLVSWWERGKNVLIIGDHGVGKTTIIKNLWDSLGIKYASFSGATLDPWTDLVGIPRPIEGDDGEFHIEYILPKTIPMDIEAIFIDEINRSHPKVRNALLELIQFKSINGRKFPNLRVIWGAANPSDTEFNYDVEELDPAQEDRFQIIVKLDTRVCYEYFEAKFGPQLATAATSWWNSAAEEVKSLISPRRLEYAVEEFVDGGDLRDILPYSEVNVLTLKRALENNRSLRDFKKLFKEGNAKGAKKFLSDASKWQDIYHDVLNKYEWADFAIQHMHPELVASVSCADSCFASLLAHHQKTNSVLRDLVKELQSGESNTDWLSAALIGYESAEIPQELETTFNGVRDGALEHCKPVSELSKRLGSESVSELLERIDCGNVGDLAIMDDTSCKNTIDFLHKCLNMNLMDQVYNKKKLARVALSVLYTTYSESGSLLPIMYYSSPKMVEWLCQTGEGNIPALSNKKKRGGFFQPSIAPKPYRPRGRSNVTAEEL